MKPPPASIMGDEVVLASYTPRVELSEDIHRNDPNDTVEPANGFQRENPVEKPERRRISAPKLEGEDDDGEYEPCGWGSCTFDYWQKFRTAPWFLVVITACASVQGLAVNGFVNTVISTLERRFEITSTESGLIASCYDIMFVLLVIPVSYFGGKGNKPRYLGIGILILGIGSFVFSLPHFLTDEYTVENAQETVCLAGNGNMSAVDPCDSNLPSDLSNYKYFFFGGQLLHGAGATALYTLGVVYIDENVSYRSSAFYNGIFYTGGIIGPAVGFIIGSEFLTIFTEPGVDAASMGLDVDNPKWVGAWWIGFLISGSLGVLLSLPLLAFPPALPGSHKFAAERGKEVHRQALEDNTGQAKGIKDILLSIRLLLCNIPFMFINLAGAADGVVLAGFSTFMPKFLEYQYGYSAGDAALYVGLIVVPTAGLATLVSGYVVQRFNMNVRSILKMCTLMAVALCPFILAFLMECQNTPYAGITVEYGATDFTETKFIGGDLDNECNAACGCNEQDYYPMCGRDNILYYSPCYAGCTDFSVEGGVKIYSNCSCVAYNLTAEDVASSDTYMGEFGKCSYNCGWISLFLPLFAIQIILAFGVTMPSLTATLRCVPDHQRSFGLGIQWIVARCLGTIPGPIIFGQMFDLACLVWQTRCDGTGSCFFYDNRKMSIYLLILSIVFCVAAALFFGLALFFYKTTDKEEENDGIALKTKGGNSNNSVLPHNAGESRASGGRKDGYDNAAVDTR